MEMTNNNERDDTVYNYKYECGFTVKCDDMEPLKRRFAFLKAIREFFEDDW